MTGRRQGVTVRTRLTLWYAAALAFVLLVYAAGVYAFLRHTLFLGLDRRLKEDVERIQDAVEVTPEGRLIWRVSGHSDQSREAERLGQRWLEVWTIDGQLVLRAAGKPLGLAPPGADAHSGTDTMEVEGQNVRMLAGRAEIAGTPVVVRSARSEEPVRHQLRELLFVQGIGVPVALVLAAVGGYQLARRALAPVGRMAEAAQRISGDRLAERLPIENPHDELGHLATVFNETFARLERSFEQMRRFTADASHELRTPLTALRSVGEVGLQERPDDRLFGDVVGSMLEEVDRMTRLVDTLLMLSRADAGQVPLLREPLDLEALSRDVASHLEDLAQEKAQTVEVVGDGPVRVAGDRLVLRQALVNVVDNAIKYGREGSPIRIVVGRNGLDAWIAVSDEGPGIAVEHRQRIFERFYRIDAARTREDGGAGLGLALVQWAVSSHGGRVEVESEPGKGSTFRIVVPA